MISRALDREITDFLSLIESHFARLRQVGHKVTKHMGRMQRDKVLQNALVVAWRRREHFDPLAEPVTMWFERCLHTAKFEKVETDFEELELLSRMSPVSKAPSSKSPQSYGTGGAGEPNAAPAAVGAPDSLDAAQKPGKDCPPCWKCRYFDGWLPRRDPKKTDYSQTELGWVCEIIDKRKIEIAQYVRGEYPEELLED